MDNDLLKRHFIKFLKQNKALGTYAFERYKWLVLSQTNREKFENLARNVTGGNYAEFTFPFEDDYYYVHGMKDSAVSSAFRWDETKKGEEFWFELCLKWSHYYINT